MKIAAISVEGVGERKPIVCTSRGIAQHCNKILEATVKYNITDDSVYYCLDRVAIP